MMEVIRFQGRNRTINIPQEISTKYQDFGILLLEDSTGARVQNTIHKHREDPEAINMDILQQWIDGRGKKPVTWETLIEVLFDIDLTTLAEDILAVKENREGETK